MKVQLLVDNLNSWILPYAEKLLNMLTDKNVDARLIHNHEDIEPGDILVLLSCEQILKNLDLNTHNLVIHESDLPLGKGWSPLTWQILEGKSEIPVTLFEAAEKVDAGKIYLQETISFKGDELLEELKHAQGEKTIELILKFVDQYPNIEGREQEGESTFYEKRTSSDSELDTSKSIDDQFNLLRVCDNERYPAFFVKDGVKYIVKISKDG